MLVTVTVSVIVLDSSASLSASCHVMCADLLSTCVKLDEAKSKAELATGEHLLAACKQMWSVSWLV